MRPIYRHEKARHEGAQLDVSEVRPTGGSREPPGVKAMRMGLSDDVEPWRESLDD